jgi:orotidine-5'-phosphate decarboxylase
MHFGDQLTAAIREKGVAACVGFDPVLEKLPEAIRPKDGASDQDAAAAVVAFGRGVISAIAPHVPVIKINIAFFEPLYAAGIDAYHELVRASHEAGLLVIGDVKRADIGHTSTQYALAQVGGGSNDVAPEAIPDAITINPYFGIDGVKPFIDVARRHGRGLFVLVQTSNPSAVEVQGLVLPDGLTVCQHVAKLVERWAGESNVVGESGYSLIGAVVSPRDLASTVVIRDLMPHSIFLVPGFGAQGRTAEEVSKCFKSDGTGALVAASRSVIYAFATGAHYAKHGEDWAACVGSGAKEFVDSLRSVLPAVSASA